MATRRRPRARRPPKRATKSRSCCSLGRLCCVFCFFIISGVIGGVILWQLLPETARNALSTIADNGIPFAGTGVGSAPPPTYPYIQCNGRADCCNGLPGLCQQRINQVMMAGIHNAQASAEDGFLLAPNHRYTLVSALDYGYRAINIDVGNCNGELFLVHGFCPLGKLSILDTFTSINAWLDANPTEILIFPLQIDNETGGAVNIQELYDILVQAGIAKRMYQLVTGEAWPTLGEMVDTDQRVLFFLYNHDDWCIDPGVSCPPGFHDWFAFAAETGFSVAAVEEFDDKTKACSVQRGRDTAPFYALNLFLKIPAPEVSKHQLNTRDFLEEHVAACRAQNANGRVNIVFVDFWEEGDLPRVVQETYNRRLALGIGFRRTLIQRAYDSLVGLFFQ